MHLFGESSSSDKLSESQIPIEIVQNSQDISYFLGRRLRLTFLTICLSLGIVLSLLTALWLKPQVLRLPSLVGICLILFVLLVFNLIWHKKCQNDIYKVRLQLSKLLMDLKSQAPQTCGSMDHQKSRSR